MKGIKDKVAFITGGEKGLGQATAARFIEEGANVVIFGIDKEAGTKTAEELSNEHNQVLFYEGDVRKEQDLIEAIQFTVEKFGRFDFAVNSAGLAHEAKPINEFTEAEYDLIMDVDLKGVFYSQKHEINEMLKTGEGKIVNIASVGGVIGTPNLGLYTIAKWGVIGMTKSTALEYAKTKIRINAMCPGTMWTPMIEDLPKKQQDYLLSAHPIGYFMDRSKIAGNIVFMCSEDGDDRTGSAVVIDGGVSAG